MSVSRIYQLGFTNLLYAIPRTNPPHPIHRPLLLLSHFLWGYSKKENEGLKRTEWYQDVSSGYFKQQTTQPQTLGYGLADSPVGLLAWIYEKLVVWTDAYPWTDDEGTNRVAKKIFIFVAQPVCS